MSISKYFRVSVVLFMAVMMTNIPHLVYADAAREMIATDQAVELLSRAEAELNVREYLKNPELKQALEQHGLSAEEVSNRIASLSNIELNDLSKQMDQARYGGDPTGGILVTILLVVLIIFLIKRI